jgi:predicted esterase
VYRRLVIAALFALTALSVLGWDSLQDGTNEPQFILSTLIDSLPSSRPVTTAGRSDDVLSAPSSVKTAEPKLTPFQLFIYIPANAAARQPLQVVIAIHGMGGEGKGFAASLIKEADRRGWLLVAPTINYGDWHNPEQVAQEDVENAERRLTTIDSLPAQTGLQLKPEVNLFGFSRGAQLAHRFALFFPERVDRVVAFSAGTYTLPSKTKDIDGDGRPDVLILPYGVGDLTKRLGRPINPTRLKQVRFYIGVGGADNVANDVPRQWDQYVGRTRVERAREFATALQSAGVSCNLQVFPGVGHEVTANMLNQAVLFFSNGEAAPLGKSRLN